MAKAAQSRLTLLLPASLYDGRTEDAADGMLLQYRRIPTPTPVYNETGSPFTATSRSPTPTLLDSSSPTEPALTSSTYKGKGRAVESFAEEHEFNHHQDSFGFAPPALPIVYPPSPVSNPAYSLPG